MEGVMCVRVPVCVHACVCMCVIAINLADPVAPSYCLIHVCFIRMLKVTRQTRPGSLKCTPTSRSGEKERLEVTTGKVLRSHFGLNPIWLTSTEEIKAAICLKSLNNVRQSVKHTPAALYIMHRRPAEGLLRRDNMTYPRERGERERHLQDGDRGGNERGSATWI